MDTVEKIQEQICILQKLAAEKALEEKRLASEAKPKAKRPEYFPRECTIATTLTYADKRRFLKTLDDYNTIFDRQHIPRAQMIRVLLFDFMDNYKSRPLTESWEKDKTYSEQLYPRK